MVEWQGETNLRQLPVSAFRALCWPPDSGLELLAKASGRGGIRKPIFHISLWRKPVQVTMRCSGIQLQLFELDQHDLRFRPDSEWRSPGARAV